MAVSSNKLTARGARKARPPTFDTGLQYFSLYHLTSESSHMDVAIITLFPYNNGNFLKFETRYYFPEFPRVVYLEKIGLITPVDPTGVST